MTTIEPSHRSGLQNEHKHMSYATAIVEAMIILFTKIPYPLNIWVYCLITIQFLAFCYVPEIEAMVAIGSMVLATVIMAYVYKNFNGMVRLTGLVHVAWVGIIPWLIYRLVFTKGKDYYEDDDKPLFFYEWVIMYTILCGISTVLDIRDVLLWFQGDRKPTVKIE